MIGDKIKLLRKAKKITQTELAKIINVKQQTLAGYESNYREPDLETVIKIADYFNVSTDWLLDRAITETELIYMYNNLLGIDKEQLKKVIDTNKLIFPELFKKQEEI